MVQLLPYQRSMKRRVEGAALDIHGVPVTCFSQVLQLLSHGQAPSGHAQVMPHLQLGVSAASCHSADPGKAC